MMRRRTICTAAFKRALERVSDNRQPDARCCRAPIARPMRWRSTAASSRTAYDAASDALGHLTDQAVANAQAASDRLGVAYRQALWLILLAIVDRRRDGRRRAHPYQPVDFRAAPQLADRMRRLAANDTDDRYSRDRAARRDRRDGAGHRGLPQQRDRTDAQPARARAPGGDARGAIGAGATAGACCSAISSRWPRTSSARP